MGNFNWLELQNGSDIRGIAIDGVIGENVNLTVERVRKIAIAYVEWLSSKKNISADKFRIAVGRDSRIWGPALMAAFIEGVKITGATAIDCGLASTPAMYMGTVFEATRYDGSVMLTASHLTYNRNGIKFFTVDGGLDKPDITAILNRAAQVTETVIPTGKSESFDLISLYADFMIKKIRTEVNHPQFFETPLKGFHIVVDAGNGAGGFYVDKVLKPLGAETSGSQFLNPDGLFPNHVPNPEDETAMKFIQEAVIANRADLGIIFDTDVDRAAAVDNLGNSINRNSLVALTAAIVLDENPGTTVVTDSITSDGLTEFIERHLQGKHHRFKRGYKNVINEAVRLNNTGIPCWLAIETSGHAALKENYFLDDGAYLVTKILIKAARLSLDGKRTVLDLIEKLRIPKESREFRFKIQVQDFKDLGNKVIKDLETYVSRVPGWSIVPNSYEGIRVSCDKSSGCGWFLLRLSLHDPVIPFNLESDTEGGVLQIARKLNDFFGQYQELDSSSLSKFVNK